MIACHSSNEGAEPQNMILNSWGTQCKHKARAKLHRYPAGYLIALNSQSTEGTAASAKPAHKNVSISLLSSHHRETRHELAISTTGCYSRKHPNLLECLENSSRTATMIPGSLAFCPQASFRPTDAEADVEERVPRNGAISALNAYIHLDIPIYRKGSCNHSPKTA